LQSNLNVQMKYKFCSIRINVTKYDVTFDTKGGSNSLLSPMATPLASPDQSIILAQFLLFGNSNFYYLQITIENVQIYYSKNSIFIYGKIIFWYPILRLEPSTLAALAKAHIRFYGRVYIRVLLIILKVALPTYSARSHSCMKLC